MVEMGQDKLGSLKFEWKGNEYLYWSRMANKLNLIDPLAGLKQKYYGIWFTWTNYQKGEK